MSFWVAAIVLTAVAVLAVLSPLSRRRAAPVLPAGNDIEVYRDQLAELDRDAERGLIGAAESEEARAEIGRRILKLTREDGSSQASRPQALTSAALAFAAVLSVPLVSWGFYALIGSPDLPAQPLAARLDTDPAKAPIDELVARAEAHLAANPDDGKGWDVLAPVYFRMGRYAEAIDAYRQAVRLLGDSAARQGGMGEAIAAQAGGLIGEDAQAAFRRALALDAKDAKARFYLASALAQQNRIAEAADAWQAMRRDLPAGSPWLGAVDAALAEADRRTANAEAPSGPSQDDVEAASQMSAADRDAMISGMVAKLDAELRENPRNPEGWQRLVRSYLVLGKQDAARDALARGVAALGGRTEEAETLQAFAVSLGLTRAE